MIKVKSALLLLLAAVAAKQTDDLNSSSYNTIKNDQEANNDHVTSILVQPGPNGPRHVILSNNHQVVPSGAGISGRAVNTDYNFHQTIPPPLTQFTYGPARPVGYYRERHVQQPQQLYHDRFHQRGKISHLKATQEETVHKYSTYIKHDKVKDLEKDLYKGYSSSQYGKPDYTVTAERDSLQQPQHEGLSKYRNRDEKEEIEFRESIGDLYNVNQFEKSGEYSNKAANPQLYSKYIAKHHSYIPNNINISPTKNYQSSYTSFDSNTYHNAPSGFDDSNGGKVLPVLAKFYKQPLPIIQTKLPADNVGHFVHYYQPQREEYDKDEVSNNYFELNPQGSYSSNSEWTPINAPDGAVPAKAYDMPAPDLSQGKPTPQKIYRRGSDDAGIVVGKTKQQTPSSSHQIQGKSEGVVSAVVRVKQ